MTILRAAVVLVLGLGLAACGFELRGSTNLPFKTFYIGVADTSPIAVALKRSIRGNGPTRLVTDPTQAEAKLEILHESSSVDIPTLNSLGQAVEYDLYYRVQFRVTGPNGRVFIPPSGLTLQRFILSNNNAVLAENYQIVAMVSDMQADAAQQILRRIEAIKPDAPPPTPSDADQE